MAAASPWSPGGADHPGAPAAVVLTSNKTEGWKETAALRAAATGQPVWTFDPQRITSDAAAQTW